MKWRFIDIPRNAGTAFIAKYGAGSVSGMRHMPGKSFEFAEIHVAIERDPIDRAVSLCAYINRNLLDDDDRNLSPEEFHAWVRSGCPYQGVTLEDTPHTPDAIINRDGAWICLPQSVWIQGCDARLLSFSSLSDSKKVSRFVRQHLRQTTDGKISKTNAGRRGSLELYEDNETKTTLAELYKSDFKEPSHGTKNSPG